MVAIGLKLPLQMYWQILNLVDTKTTKPPNLIPRIFFGYTLGIPSHPLDIKFNHGALLSPEKNRP